MPTIPSTVTLTGTPLVTTPAASLVMQQTGDTFGTTKMSLFNRTGINGPLFENLGLDLVDFGMKPSGGLQCVIRNAHAAFQMDSTSNPAGELHFQFDSLTGGGKTGWVFGEALTATATRLVFGTLSVGNPPANRDVGITRNAANVLEVNTGTVGAFATLKCDKLNAVTGYQINGAAVSNKILKANGTNFVASTETYDPPGPAGTILVSDGTNWKSRVSIQNNASVAQQPLSTSDVYLAGSLITVPAGSWTAGSTYWCTFIVVKTLGTGTIVVTVRIGTAGTTGDGILVAFTMPAAGTSVGDNARFEIFVNIRTIGTSATSIGEIIVIKNATAAAGMVAVAQQVILGSPTAGTAFNSTTATKIGVSFNGSTAFTGNCDIVQAEYTQL